MITTILDIIKNLLNIIAWMIIHNWVKILEMMVGQIKLIPRLSKNIVHYIQWSVTSLQVRVYMHFVCTVFMHMPNCIVLYVQ